MKNFFQGTKLKTLGDWFWIALVFVFFSFSLSSFWARDARTASSPPAIITYQGKLVENGEAVTTTKAVTFLIYDAPNGGNVVYTAGGNIGAPSSIDVTPSQGIFSVDFGGSGTNVLSTSTFASATNLYLEVRVGATTLSPRKLLSSAPYAINSQYLMGITATTTSSSLYIPHSDANGNFEFTGTPQNSAVSGGVIYVNPGSATENHTLFGLAVAGTEKFRVDAEGDAWITGTSTISGDLNVDGGTLFVDHINNFVGINSSTPSVALSVNGQSYFTGTSTLANKLIVEGRAKTPLVAGMLVDNGTTGLSGAIDMVVQGDYAYVVGSTDSALEIINISKSNNPSHVGKFVDNGKSLMSSPAGVAVAGNYAYVTSNDDDAVNVIDISDPSSPKFVSVIKDSDSPSLALDAATTVTLSGKYLYVTSENESAIEVLDISNPAKLRHAAAVRDSASTRLANPHGIFVRGNYLYACSSIEDALQIIDITNPENPIPAGYLFDAINLDFAYGVFVKGNYAYVISAMADIMEIIDVSNPYDPRFVSRISDSEAPLLTSPNGIFVNGNYAYVVASNGLQIVDVTYPLSPVNAGSITHSANNLLSSSQTIKIIGNYSYSISSGNASLTILDLSGAVIANSEVGSSKITNLQVTDGALFEQGLSVHGGVTVGPGGVLVNGDIGLSTSSTLTSATNTLSFSHVGVFKSLATTTNKNIFVFDTANLYSQTSSSTTYLLSVRNNGVNAFSVASNGDVAASGTLYAATVNVGTPGSPGDLAEKVDIAPDDTAEPGDVMVVDPTREDTYRRSSGPYEQAVAGVISTNPTLTIGFGKTSNSAVLAMVGRVPIKVSAENGPISRGDILVTASTTGYAMRYDASKDDDTKIVGIIGVALEPLAEGQGKIMGLIRTGFVNNRHKTIADIQQELTDLAETQGGIGAGNELNVGENNGQLVFLQSDLDANAYSILNVKKIVGKEGKWEVDEEGRFITRLDTSEGKKSLYSLQSGDTEYVFSGSSHLVAGVARIDFDAVTKELIDPEKPIKVNITLTSEALGVFISGKDATGFVVKELQGGASAATFDWVVIASRKSADQQVQSNNDQQVPPPEQNSNPPADENPPAQNENNNAPEENPPAQEENNPPADAPQDEAPPQNQPEEQNPPADQPQDSASADSAPPEASAAEG